MRAEMYLWRVAIACAALLLFAPLTPRTSWMSLGGTESRADGGGQTHSAGWDWLAPVCGLVAMGSLAAGRSRRPRVFGSVLGAGIASVSFAVAAAAALGHWLDLMSGSLAYARWTIHPAPGVAYFAGIAGVGLVASLVLLGSWLRPGIQWVN